MDQSCWDLAIVFYYLLLVQTVPAFELSICPDPQGHGTRLVTAYHLTSLE